MTCKSRWIGASGPCIVEYTPHAEHNDGLGGRWADGATDVNDPPRHEQEPFVVKASWIATSNTYPVATKTTKSAKKGKPDWTQEPTGVEITVWVSREEWDRAIAAGQNLFPHREGPTVLYEIGLRQREPAKPKEPETVGLFAEDGTA